MGPQSLGDSQCDTLKPYMITYGPRFGSSAQGVHWHPRPPECLMQSSVSHVHLKSNDCRVQSVGKLGHANPFTCLNVESISRVTAPFCSDSRAQGVRTQADSLVQTVCSMGEKKKKKKKRGL